MIDSETIQALNHETKVRKSKEDNIYAKNKKKKPLYASTRRFNCWPI